MADKKRTAIINSDCKNYILSVELDTYTKSKKHFPINNFNLNNCARYTLFNNNNNINGCGDINIIVSENFCLVESINAVCPNIIDNLLICKNTTYLVHVGIRYILDRYPQIKKITVNNDNNKYYYKNSLYLSEKLTYFYLAIYGKTWYEVVLNAKLDSADQAIKYNKYMLRFKKYPKCSWNEFCAKLNITPDSNEYELILNTYENTKSYFDFFQGLKSKKVNLTNSLGDFYDLLVDWLYKFMELFIFKDDIHIIQGPWILDISTIPKLQYDIWYLSTDETPTGYRIL